MVISRKKNTRGGTYGSYRGLDDQGEVANFVETEQIIQIDGKVYSYVTFSATPALFYNHGNDNLLQSASITKPQKAAQLPFNKHLQDLLKQYKFVLMINLLSENFKNLSEELSTLA